MIQVISSHSVILMCIAVYMPFYTGSSEQTEFYVETLDLLQELLDTYSEGSPVMVLGDYNTTLPQSTTLRDNWYCSRPFTKYSFLLYEFLTENDFTAANFDFNQNIKYTYFKDNVTSYIDHCVVTRQLKDHVINCRILSNHSDCASDHFPIEILVSVPIRDPQNSTDTIQTHSYVNWNDKHVKECYTKELTMLIANMKTPRLTADVQSYVYDYVSTIVNLMHTAGERATVNMCSSSSKRKRKRCKHWWNVECTTARNKNRFWFSLWRSLGRPRDGAVSNACKYSIYIFRKVCRGVVNKCVKFNFSQCDKRMVTFWNTLRKARSPGCNNNLTDISLNVLEQHFKKFSYDVTNENEFVSQCRESVEEKLKNCMICYEDFVFS